MIHILIIIRISNNISIFPIYYLPYYLYKYMAKYKCQYLLKYLMKINKNLPYSGLGIDLLDIKENKSLQIKMPYLLNNIFANIIKFFKYLIIGIYTKFI